MKTLQHKFVEFIPDNLEDGVLYVSIEFRTAIHRCACGCGKEVVTPLSPTDWRLTFDGDSISLYPSIGNWNFDCKSHYFVTNNRIHYVPKWDRDYIERGRKEDAERKQSYYSSKEDIGDS